MSNEIEKEKQNIDELRKAKKRKKLRSAIIMALVCVMIMSGATYAWFTLSNNAKVSGLSLKVTSEGKLLIANDETTVNGESYSINSLDWASTEETLLPCTTKDGINFYKPNYSNENTVSGLTKLGAASGYYLEKTIWLRIVDNSSADNAKYNVVLSKKISESDGTFIKEGNNNKGAQNCIRVAFVLNEATSAAAIYEPNSNSSNTASTVINAGSFSVNNNGTISNENSNLYGTQDSSASLYSKLKPQLSVGTFSGTDSNSETLFEITNKTATQVTMRFWFDGMDPDCSDSIDLGNLIGQFKFIANKQ